MDIQEAIQKRDQLKVDIGIMENKRTTILSGLKDRFGTDDVQQLLQIRADKSKELEAATAQRTAIEAELDTLFAGK